MPQALKASPSVRPFSQFNYKLNFEWHYARSSLVGYNTTDQDHEKKER